MLIDELLYEENGPVKDASKKLVKGVGNFIKGARGGKDITNPLTGKSIFAYGDDAGENSTRSVGKKWPPQEAFNRVLKNVYADNLNDQIINDFATAIKSNDKTQVEKISSAYKNEQKERGQNWKGPNKDVIAALMKYYKEHPDEKL